MRIVHHMSFEQLEVLADTFAFMVQRDNGVVEFELPEWWYAAYATVRVSNHYSHQH